MEQSNESLKRFYANQQTHVRTMPVHTHWCQTPCAVDVHKEASVSNAQVASRGNNTYVYSGKISVYVYY